ncbi:MAG: tRNA (adenosine(37)-N6)-threonylcarbamoyltransferase complex ATPase subunit type 1 TsaE [Fimbriimonadaceae bacterium]
MERFSDRPEATAQVGAELARLLSPGDVVLLEGGLGAGKTTLVRGLVTALGHAGPVRSPTFNLLQEFDTRPPVLHADLYRVESHLGLGIEDYLASHVVVVEWPDRAEGLFDRARCWRVAIAFAGGGRRISVVPPETGD